jgi:hypothetical protein
MGIRAGDCAGKPDSKSRGKKSTYSIEPRFLIYSSAHAEVTR